MCVVSMVTDHYWRKWPNPVEMPKDIYSDLEELIRKAREYDRIMNQPDCPDPLKQDWYQKLQKLQGNDMWMNVTKTDKDTHTFSNFPPGAKRRDL